MKKCDNLVRNADYDWLRLIAIALVVIGHSTYLSITTKCGGINYMLPENINGLYFSLPFEIWRWMAGFVYEFHMPLFFMLSGAMLSFKPLPSFGEMLRGKIKRLIIPYFACGTLFMLPMKYISDFYADKNLEEAYVYFLSGNVMEAGHLWFLGALLWCFIVFYLLKITVKHTKADTAGGLLVLAGILQFGEIFCFSNIGKENTSFLPCSIFLPEICLIYIFWFVSGYYFEKKRQGAQAWPIKKVWLLTGLFLVGEYVIQRFGCPSNMVKIILGSALMYCFARVCSYYFDSVTKSTVWKLLVRNYYWIYIFHDPLEYVVLKIFFGQGYLTGCFGCVMYFVFRTVFVVVVSVGLGELLDYGKKLFSAGKKVNSSQDMCQ